MDTKDPYLMNRLGNKDNRYQNFKKHKRVLCVCSAGLLRSPTAAFVLSQDPWNHNTRAAGLTPQFALVPVDQVLLEWADEIVVMTSDQSSEVQERLSQAGLETPVVCLNVPDNYGYRDPVLMDLIRDNYSAETRINTTEV